MPLKQDRRNSTFLFVEPVRYLHPINAVLNSFLADDAQARGSPSNNARSDMEVVYPVRCTRDMPGRIEDPSDSRPKPS